MNNEQKQRALQVLRRFEQAVSMTRQADSAAVGVATLLQELVDAKEPEPVGEAVDFNGWRIVRWKGKESDFQVGTKFYTSPPAKNQSEQHIEMVNAPAPSVPDEQLQAAFDRGLKAGNEQAIAQQIEIHKLHDLLAAPLPPKLSDDRIREILVNNNREDKTVRDFARAIEREILGRLGMTEVIDVAIATEKGGA